MKSCYQSPSLKSNRKVSDVTMCCSRFCFIVLVLTSASEGQNETTSAGMTTKEPTNATLPTLTGQVTNSTAFMTTTNSSVKSTTLEKQTPTPTTNIGVVAGRTTPATTTTTQTTPASGGTSSSPGYVILGLMIVVIIILIIILFLFRRASRTYSFDLHRPSPATRINEPTGTFDPIYLDDLDMPIVQPETELAPSSVPNGTSGQEQAVEQNPNGTAVLNGAPDDITTEKTSSLLDDGDLLLDLDEQRPVTEQNNNPFCAADPFEEVNLDEPVCSDQLHVDFSSVVDIIDSSPSDFSSLT